MNSKKILVFGVISSIALSSCVTTTTVKPTSQFDEQTFLNGLKEGGSAIEGQGFMKTMVGDVKYAAGSNVLLVPATQYVEECVFLARNNPYSKLDCDPRVRTLGKSTQADGEGKFRFENLSIGRFYVETSVVWYIPNGLFPLPQGGNVGNYVEIKNDGETAKVILTR